MMGNEFWYSGDLKNVCAFIASSETYELKKCLLRLNFVGTSKPYSKSFPVKMNSYNFAYTEKYSVLTTG